MTASCLKCYPSQGHLHFIEKAVVIPRLSSLVALLCVTCESSVSSGRVIQTQAGLGSTPCILLYPTPCAIWCPILESPAAPLPVLSLPPKSTGPASLLPYLPAQPEPWSCTAVQAWSHPIVYRGTEAPMDQKSSESKTQRFPRALLTLCDSQSLKLARAQGSRVRMGTRLQVVP